MIVMGFRKLGNDKTIKEDGLNVRSRVTKEAGIYQNGFRKHLTGGAKKGKPGKNYNIYYT